MPYENISELPQSVRNAIPSDAGRSMFMRVVNSQLDAGKSESVSFASAWAAIEDAGYKKSDEGKWIKKARGAVPMYAYRPVLNAEEIGDWAKSNGLETTLDPEDMHVTVVYSRRAYASIPDNYPEPYGGLAGVWADKVVVRGGSRAIARLGKEGEALVLKIENERLSREHLEHREMGASWDWDTYQPHITLSYQAGEQTIPPFEGDIVLGPMVYQPLDPDWKSGVVEKTAPTNDDVHVPTTGRKKPMKKVDGYTPPASARNNAKKAITWREKYGDEVKGGTRVGWTRASQLAGGEKLSLSTVKRMAQFNRHRKNSEVDPKYRDEPWKDAGHVAWLLWGGTTGVDWARGVASKVEKRMVKEDSFTMPEEARARSAELGLGGEIHVYEVDGQAVYMPGEDHEDYLEAFELDEDEENDSEDENGDLLERVVSAIMATVMKKNVDHISGVQIVKMDDEQRIVWGWASVATVNGEPVFDLHGDHIPMSELTKASTEFMLTTRVGKTMHFGTKRSDVVHSLPLSKELASMLGVSSEKEGWIVGFKVHDDTTWDMIKSGELPALSIGGIGDLHAAE